MTREEAIDVLKQNYPSPCFEDLCEAVEIAVQALSAQPECKKGKWIQPCDITGFGRCSNCNALWDNSLIENRFFRHCPRCGADMRGEEE